MTVVETGLVEIQGPFYLGFIECGFKHGYLIRSTFAAHTKGVPVTLHQLLSLYLQHRLVRPATVRCYADALTNLAAFSKASGTPCVQLDDMTVDTLLAHRQWCLQRMQGISYNKHRRHLRALLNFAVGQELLAKSPLAKVSPAPTQQVRPKTVPENWYARTHGLLQFNDGHVPATLMPARSWLLVFAILHFTGMRRRQVAELCWGHVDCLRSALRLAAASSKSGREWLVPLPLWLLADLQALRVDVATLSGRDPLGTEQVFAGLTCERVSRAFVALSKLLGYTISSHRVRHTTATVMLERSGNLTAVSNMLGHADIKLTASTYIHPSLEALRQVQQGLQGYGTIN